MQDFNAFLKGMDSKTLEEGMKKASAFAKTAEGQKMIASFKGNMPADKESLIKTLAANPEILKTVESFLKQ